MNRLCCVGESSSSNREAAEWRDRNGRQRVAERACSTTHLGRRIATVLGGLILWSVTSLMSQPTPTTERMAVAWLPPFGPCLMAPRSPHQRQAKPLHHEWVRTCRSQRPSGPRLPNVSERESASLFCSRRINLVVRELLALPRRKCNGLGAKHLCENGFGSPQLACFQCRWDASSWS